MTDYHHTKFGLIWIKQSKATEVGGGGGGIRPPPQVDNVLNRKGEIGLKKFKNSVLTRKHVSHYGVVFIVSISSSISSILFY